MSTEPPMLFLSYSVDDTEFATRLQTDLQAQGYNTWIDKAGIKPGTPDWEDALRGAIRRARAVLLVASPSSRNSRYVKDELRIAGMYRLPLVPVWARGDEWMDSIPMGWGGVQYCDARGPRYQQALQEVLATLRELAITPSGGFNSAANLVPSAVPVAPSSPLPANSVLASSVPANSLAPDVAPRNPYKGLRPFSSSDAGDFFGRDAAVKDLIGVMQATLVAVPYDPASTRLFAVVGASGSGKSSLVMAGLLPRLRAGAIPGSDRWVYLDSFVPGAHPLETLAVALASGLPERSLRAIREDLAQEDARGLHLLAASAAKQAGTQVVLVVDQSEELFTLTADERERQHFIELLTAAVTEPRGPLIVLLTLRADMYDRPMRYPEFFRLLTQHEQATLAMDVEELRAVIEQPAALPDVQLTFEEPLVGDLLFEVQDQAGALPLLEFTLDQLYQRRVGHRLTVQAYRDIGGVRGALAKHAEATYLALPSDQHRAMAHFLFLRLIDPGATSQDTTRRRASLRELSLPDPVQARVIWDVANAFIMARLLVTADIAGVNTIEVCHEALIREWARLAEWVREGREDIRLAQQISMDAREWLQHNRAIDRLYRGAVLAEAQAWMARAAPSTDELEFIQAGIAESQREAREELDRKTRELALQKRVAQRQRVALTLSGVTGLVLIAAVIVQIFAQASLNRANETLKIANAHLKASLAVSVTNLNDTGPGSLRNAIVFAPSGGAITFEKDLRGTITLTSGDLVISNNVEISGPGTSQLTISGGNSSRVFNIQGGDVTITNLTIADGHASDDGGGISNAADNLLLINVELTRNRADRNGGAVYNVTNFIAINSTLDGNQAGNDGGGIFNDGTQGGATIKMYTSTVTGNQAGHSGGGVAQLLPGSLGPGSLLYVYVSGSVVRGNSAPQGGGIYIQGGSYLEGDATNTITANTPGNFACSPQAGCPS